MSSGRARVRSSRGYAVVDVAVASMVSLVLAAWLAPSIQESRQRGMDTGLAARVQLLRGAVWMFRAEHNEIAPSPEGIEAQLLGWTDAAGESSPGHTTLHFISPYLRQIPELTVGSRAGARAIGPADGPGVGWTYVDGIVRANAAPGECDTRGVSFLDY